MFFIQLSVSHWPRRSWDYSGQLFRIFSHSFPLALDFILPPHFSVGFYVPCPGRQYTSPCSAIHGELFIFGSKLLRSAGRRAAASSFEYFLGSRAFNPILFIKPLSIRKLSLISSFLWDCKGWWVEKQLGSTFMQNRLPTVLFQIIPLFVISCYHQSKGLSSTICLSS